MNGEKNKRRQRHGQGLKNSKMPVPNPRSQMSQDYVVSGNPENAHPARAA